MKLYFFWLDHDFKRPLCVCQENYKGIVFLPFYVDDILLARNNMEMIKITKQWLSSVFEMKYMGDVRYVLSENNQKPNPRNLLI